MEDWKEIWSFESSEAVQEAAVQALQDSGVNVPQGNIHATQTQAPTSHGAFFGVSLECDWQPTLSYRYSDSIEFQLPRFFVEAVHFLEEHSSREGIFRKAGSVARQKALRATLDAGNPSISKDANVHDVACLLKQYLRELPEPLITSSLLPVFEASYSLLPRLSRARCILLSCLLLPKIHLQCLCVLMKLLHGVAELATESLMDSSNLAIVVAPNVTRPHIDILSAAQGNPLKYQAAIVQILIENSSSIGHAPPEVTKVIEAIQGDPLRATRSLETVLESSGSKGHDLPSRYAGGKHKKQRTNSLSGLVLGLGNRLWSRGGVASESGDSHVTDGAAPKRRPSMKRHGSADDLLCSEASKRRAMQVDSTPQAATPDHTHKHKRRHLLSRHRHSGARRSKASSKFHLAQQKFFNFRVTPKPPSAQQEVGVVDMTSSSSAASDVQVLPAQQFVYTGGNIEVEGQSIKRKLLNPSLGSQAKPISTAPYCTDSNSGNQVGGAGICPQMTSDLCDPTKKERVATNIDTAISMSTVGVAQNDLVGVANPPTVPHVPIERPTKKIKCDIKWGEDDSVEGEPNLKIRESKSDFALKGGKDHHKTGDQSPFKFVTPRGIPPSKSHPTFPFSQPRPCLEGVQPRPHLEGVRFPFLDPQNDPIEKASFPFTPHARGVSKINFPDPQNDPIQKASFPFTPFPSLKPAKTPPSQEDYHYSFAKPTPLNVRNIAHTTNMDTDSLSCEPSFAHNLNKAFVNDSQNEGERKNDGSIHLPNIVHETTPTLIDDHMRKANINSKAALLRRLSSVHGRATPHPLDDAFLNTPFLLSSNSPNLLEKITSEIALRHNFSPAHNSPVASSKSLPTLTSNSASQQHGGTESAMEGVRDGDGSSQGIGATGSQTSLVASEREMFKELVLRVNDSYKKAVEENGTGPLLGRNLEMVSSEDGSLSKGVDLGGSRDNESTSMSVDNGCFDSLLPQKLKFDSSHCDSDLSILSGNEVTTAVIQQHTALGNSLPVKTTAVVGNSSSVKTATVVGNSLPINTDIVPSQQFVKSPTVAKAKKPRSRQLVTPRSSARRTMAYSATLGLSEQLLVPRNLSQSRKPTSSKGVGGGSTLGANRKPGKTTASLSASLGITELSLGGSGPEAMASRGRGRGKEMRGNAESSTQEKSLASISSDILERFGDKDNIKTESPTPVLLHILEANGVPNFQGGSDSKGTSDGKGGSDAKGESCSKANESQSKRMRKSMSTTNIKRCYDNKHLKPPVGKVYSSDEPLNYKFRAIGGTIQSDCSVVTRPPSPRLPFGLRSPWFRSSNKEETVAHGQGIRATQGGKISKRVQPYVVSGPIPISHSEHTSLRRIVKTSTETVNNENDYHDDSHVI